MCRTFWPDEARSGIYVSGLPDKNRDAARAAGIRLAKHPEIQEALARARDEQAHIRAGGCTAVGFRPRGVAVELGRIGFANMLDYMRVGPSGDPVLDFTGLTREQAAALTEVTVDDYIDGRGRPRREVRKVKFKLGDKRAALMPGRRRLSTFRVAGL